MTAANGHGRTIIVGTRKGVWRLDPNGAPLEGPAMFGHIVNHVVSDPRAPDQWVMGVKTGHLGPTVMRSPDRGGTWKEAKRPPAFAKTPDGTGPAVNAVFWITAGHASEPGVWYAGTDPHGLFRTEDGGDTWSEVAGFTRALEGWKKTDRVGGVPGGAFTHSVLVDPRDAGHLYIGLSVGGFFESVDRGESWTPLNQGVASTFSPEKDPEYGHDPHCVAIHPARPDRLYQQNHCGLYRIDRPGTRWVRIGDNMPREIGDIGFPIVVHPRDADTAWAFPMDGTDVWPRTSVGGRPAAYRTRDAGATWERQDRGLPSKQGWFTVYRQAMAADAGDPVGLYFGTTSGDLWASADEGASWRRLAESLPAILSVTVAERA